MESEKEKRKDLTNYRALHPGSKKHLILGLSTCIGILCIAITSLIYLDHYNTTKPAAETEEVEINDFIDDYKASREAEAPSITFTDLPADREQPTNVKKQLNNTLTTSNVKNTEGSVEY